MPIPSTSVMARFKIVAFRIWYGIREWCGDAAYERYAQSRANHSCNSVLLSREEFYLEQLRRRYSRVSRCC
jgi:uncharacterized short protein YbdD (DUF466 family)